MFSFVIKQICIWINDELGLLFYRQILALIKKFVMDVVMPSTVHYFSNVDYIFEKRKRFGDACGVRKRVNVNRKFPLPLKAQNVSDSNFLRNCFHSSSSAKKAGSGCSKSAKFTLESYTTKTSTNLVIVFILEVAKLYSRL